MIRSFTGTVNTTIIPQNSNTTVYRNKFNFITITTLSPHSSLWEICSWLGPHVSCVFNQLCPGDVLSYDTRARLPRDAFVTLAQHNMLIQTAHHRRCRGYRTISISTFYCTLVSDLCAFEFCEVYFLRSVLWFRTFSTLCILKLK